MQPYKIALVALNDISAFHLSVPCLVFQDVFLGQQAAFELTICSEESEQITLSSGFQASVNAGLDNIEQADIIVIPGWPNHLPEPSHTLISKLKAAHKRGAMVVGLCLVPTYWLNQGCWTVDEQRPIGDTRRSSSRDFLMSLSIATRYLLNKTISSRLRAPPPRSIAVCTLYALFVAAKSRHNLLG